MTMTPIIITFPINIFIFFVTQMGAEKKNIYIYCVIKKNYGNPIKYVIGIYRIPYGFYLRFL